MPVYDELIESQRILSEAIKLYKPRALVCLFSGGYDSMITAHILHRLNTHGLAIQVWAIDTQLAVDGWRHFVRSVAKRFDWNFQIYDNEKGFQQFVTLVEYHGCPYSKKMHTFVYQRLKERGIDAIHVMNKKQRNDKTLFVTGIRRAESHDRGNAPEHQSFKKNNKRFCSPIVHWNIEECNWYRLMHNLPTNPFYDTVKGSGDCQCNWGRFITLRMLRKFSPILAAGNVAIIDKLSRKLHGYGWDGKLEGQQEMFEDFDGEGELTAPFLCEGCTMHKIRVPNRTIEQRYLQLGFEAQ